MLTVRLFAQLRDQFDADTVRVEAGTVAGLRLALDALRPAAASLLARCRIAVNLEFVDDDHAVGPGDEIAVIPPVSGG